MPTMSATYMRDYRAKIAMSESDGGLLPFQSAFVAALTRKDQPPAICCLSTSRAQGKSWLCGQLISRSITPNDELFEPAVENILVSSSVAQARIVLEFARQDLGDAPGYRWRNDGVVHLESRARVRVISSDSRRAMGLGAACRLIVADEPGSWSAIQGRRLYDAMSSSLGKRRTQLVLVGTLSPGPLTGPGAWWFDLVQSGSGDGRHVQLLAADPAKWEDFDEVLRVNPVAAINPYLKQTLEREHKAALESDRAARTFRQFRLNIPGDPVDHQPLVTTSEWERVCTRQIPASEGKPVIGVDLGGNRSWSAAAAIWPSGRIASWAVAPGSPSLADQEKADQVPDDSYLELVKSGGLSVDAGRAVPSVELLLARAWEMGPAAIVCDSYRADELRKAVQGRCRVIERARSHGEATSNVQSLRSLLLDTASGVALESRSLLASAFEQTNLIIDSGGLTKVAKRDQRRSRDDAAAALLLACGEQARRPAPVELRGAVISKSGEVTWL